MIFQQDPTGIVFPKKPAEIEESTKRDLLREKRKLREEIPKYRELVEKLIDQELGKEDRETFIKELDKQLHLTRKREITKKKDMNDRKTRLGKSRLEYEKEMAQFELKYKIEKKKIEDRFTSEETQANKDIEGYQNELADLSQEVGKITEMKRLAAAAWKTEVFAVTTLGILSLQDRYGVCDGSVFDTEGKLATLPARKQKLQEMLDDGVIMNKYVISKVETIVSRGNDYKEACEYLGVTEPGVQGAITLKDCVGDAHLRKKETLRLRIQILLDIEVDSALMNGIRMLGEAEPRCKSHVQSISVCLTT